MPNALAPRSVLRRTVEPRRPDESNNNDQGTPKRPQPYDVDPPEPQPLHDLLDQRTSFVLLAAPGAGKSTALRDIAAAAGAPPPIDLAQVSQRSDLVHLVAAAIAGQSSPVVALDSIDECALPTKVLAAAITNAFKAHANVRIFAACRGHAWTDTMATALLSVDPGLLELDLLPLTPADVRLLAQARGIDADAFEESIRRAGAQPLTQLPLSLTLLFLLFEADGRLPTRSADVYEQGLTRLADEHDTDRDPAVAPAGSAMQRLAVASRIAAAIALSDATSISTRHPDDSATLGIGDVVAGQEDMPAGSFDVSDELVRATLETALFAPVGLHRHAVYHASCEAYLAGRWLHHHLGSRYQLESLLTVQNSTGGTGIPMRVAEIAAWLVAISPVDHGWLLGTDPLALLPYAAQISDPDLRRELAAAYITGEGNTPTFDRLRIDLSHPGLAAQLSAEFAITLQTGSGVDYLDATARRTEAAIEIARAGNTVEVVGQLISMVQARHVNIHLRGNAAYALRDIDLDAARACMREVLHDVSKDPETDSWDELRGIALAILWPDTLTITELVAVLKAPQRRDYIGAYRAFLYRMADNLTDEQMRNLVLWLATAPSTREWVDEEDEVPGAPLMDTGRTSSRVLARLVESALNHPALGSYLDEAASLLIRLHPSGVSVPLPRRFAVDADDESRDLRRAFVTAILRAGSVHGAAGAVFYWDVASPPNPEGSRSALVDEDDIDWLASLLDGEDQSAAATLLASIFNVENSRHVDILHSHRHNPALAAFADQQFNAVALDSEAANDLRQYHARSQPWVWPERDEQQATVQKLWQRCAAGDVGAFGELAALLLIDPSTGDTELEFGPADRWPSFSLLPCTLAEFGDAGLAWLTVTDPSGSWELTSDHFSRTALIGVGVLQLLASIDDGDLLASIPATVWQQWLPALARLSPGHDYAALRLRQQLVHAAGKTAPHALEDALAAEMTRCVEHGKTLSVHVESAAPRTPSELARVLDVVRACCTRIDELRRTIDSADADDPTNTSATPESRALSNQTYNLRQLLLLVTSETFPPGIDYLLDLVAAPKAHSPEVRANAATVLVSSHAVPWPVIRAHIDADPAMGRLVAIELARDDDNHQRSQHDEATVADMWRWLERSWPRDDNPMSSGFVSPEQNVHFWRGRLVEDLATRGTPAATAHLARLSTEFPDSLSLRHSLARSVEREETTAWTAVPPSELFNMAEDARRVLARDDDDLYRMVLRLLDEFALTMQHTGYLLWNESPTDADPVYRPKYETDVSHLIATHLQRELRQNLVVGREVMVKATDTKGAGHRVDVYVASPALTPGARQPQCIIEVKGSWNSGLMKDIDRQLVGQYLNATGATRGVYVCAWFPHHQWTGHDSRLPKARKDRNRTVRDLRSRAADASTNGRSITALVIDIPRATQEPAAPPAVGGGGAE